MRCPVLLLGSSDANGATKHVVAVSALYFMWHYVHHMSALSFLLMACVRACVCLCACVHVCVCSHDLISHCVCSNSALASLSRTFAFAYLCVSWRRACKLVRLPELACRLSRSAGCGSWMCELVRLPELACLLSRSAGCLYHIIRTKSRRLMMCGFGISVDVQLTPVRDRCACPIGSSEFS